MSRELKSVVQSKVDPVARGQTITSDHPSETWATCGRLKCHPHRRGKFPGFRHTPPNVPTLKTAEWWGSGASANKQVIISNALYRGNSGQSTAVKQTLGGGAGATPRRGLRLAGTTREGVKDVGGDRRP